MNSTRRGLIKLPPDEGRLMAGPVSADAILSGLPMAILVIDTQQEIVQINSAAEDFVGTSAKHIHGKNNTEYVRFNDTRLTAALIDPDANLAAHRAEILLKGHNKRRCDFFINTLPSNSVLRIVTISPLPMVEQASGGEAKEQGAFGLKAPDILAHEIKNPLAAIKGAAQLIGRGLDAEKKSLTEMITSEVERVAKLLDQMQQLSTTQPAKLEPINIHTVIDRARRAILAGQGNEVIITDEFDPSLPEVEVDSDAMMQILVNILANAAEATADVTDRRISIQTRYTIGASFASGNETPALRLPVEIEIADNGPGIAAELAGDIFDPFVTSKNEGQGLGLALVRKLIRDMRGRIRYERDENAQLTKFKIFLPVADTKRAESI